VSQENVEMVRDSFDAFAKGGLDALEQFWYPDINWRAIEGAPDDVGEMLGIEAVRRYLQDWLEMFDDITVVPEKLIDVGDDRVIAVQLSSGRAKLSGIEAQLRYAVVYTVSDGKILRGREYAELAEALKSVGLEE
jgi:ketosteroid isomerase-like protein